MPVTTIPFSSNNQHPPYPALYLYPLNDSFIPKHISLLHNQRVKIGRQTNAKTAPGERNGYFDSKVLSRQHAEVWEENNKIFIKDVKSSNGTFINGERLSPEGLESDPYELKSDDIVEFGIDIVGEDNKTIIHHKVAARVVCVFTEQDVQVAARAEQHQAQQAQSQQQQYRDQSSSSSSSSSLLHQSPGTSSSSGSSSSSSAFNFAGNQSHRRPQLAQQGIAGMGGMGGSMRPPGKSGLTFDHILSRLQGELQKSRETGAELHTLTNAMTEIHDTLGGTLPPNLPPYPQTLPPVRPGLVGTQPQPQPESQPQPQPGITQPPTGQSQPLSQPQPSTSQPQSTSSEPTTSLTDLQNQLQETQSSLSMHVDKVRALEGVLAEQEAIRREMRALREMMERRKGEDVRSGSHLHAHEHEHGYHREDLDNETDDEFRHESLKLLEEPRCGFDLEDEDQDQDQERERERARQRERIVDDDDDAQSLNTVVPHELERVEEEDEDALADGDESESEGVEGRYEDLEIEMGERAHERRDHPDELDLHYSHSTSHSSSQLDGDLDSHDRDEDQHQHEDDPNHRDTSRSTSDPEDAEGVLDGEAEGEGEGEGEGEEEGDGEDDEASRRRRSAELGRPRTPEPASLGMGMGKGIGIVKLSATRRTRSPTSPLSQVMPSSAPNGVRVRMQGHGHAHGQGGKEIEVEQVMEQVGTLMALTTALEAQHAAAQNTIAALESKVVALEAEVRAAQQVVVLPSSPVEVQDVEEHKSQLEEGEVASGPARVPTPEREQEREREQESLTAMVSEWTKTMEGKWSSVQEDWSKERERLNHAREEWEAKTRMMDSGLEKLSSLSVALQERERELRGESGGGGVSSMGNGEAVKHAGESAPAGANPIGLVTPPSPRSLSSDSGRSRRRRGRGRGGGKGSRSVSPDTDTDVTLASEEGVHDHEEAVKAKVHAYAYANGLGHEHEHGRGHAVKIGEGDGHEDGEEEEEEEEDTVLGVRSVAKGVRDGAGTLATPESSVYKLENSGELDGEEVRAPGVGVGKRDYLPHAYYIQTAIGVLVLSVAAAAVIWRVKPET